MHISGDLFFHLFVTASTAWAFGSMFKDLRDTLKSKNAFIDRILEYLSCPKCLGLQLGIVSTTYVYGADSVFRNIGVGCVISILTYVITRAVFYIEKISD